jgi:hypothetical protein
VTSPFYFAYEDLLEDWNKATSTTSTSTKSVTPKVEVRDFTEVMLLAKGIDQETISKIEKAVTGGKVSEVKNSEEKKIVAGIVPTIHTEMHSVLLSQRQAQLVPPFNFFV